MDRPSVERDLSIDKHNLDTEWVNHPTNVLHYSEQAIEAERVLARLELKKDAIVATLDEDARRSDERMTENKVKNYIIRQPGYQAVEEEIIEAKYELNMLKAVVKALDSKRKGLEKIVDLYITNYFSEPRSPIGAELVQEQLATKLSQTKFASRRTHERQEETNTT